ncbi:GGDEF domain-containing protein, partial [Flavobacterium sp.]|uniref:GGDEF domain-containing protein n=1 Tax=Flavobacterium sp. TaxID=239 RepID=UPI00379B3B1E
MLTYKNIVENLDVGIAIVRNGKYLSNINLAFKNYLSLENDVADIKSLLTLIDSDSISIDKFKIFINYPDNIKSSFILNLNSGIVLGCNLKRLSTDNIESLDLLSIQDLTSQEVRIRQLTIESQQDELTGIANRRKFEYEFSRTYEFALRTKITGALILLDLDNFKSINDRFGHSAGDSVLRQVGLALSPVVRNYEMLARVGGDEFAILISHSGEEAIERLIQQIPLALKSIKINPNDTKVLTETLEISMG